MIRSLFFSLFWFVIGAMVGLTILLNLSEEREGLGKKVITAYPNARFLSQVDAPGGASAVFLCEEGKLIVVVKDRVFHSSVTHENDNFSCK